MPLFGRQKKKDAKKQVDKPQRLQHNIVIQAPDVKGPTIISPGLQGPGGDSNSPSPTTLKQDAISQLVPASWSKSASSLPRRESGPNVAVKKTYFEKLSSESSTGNLSPRRISSPEKRKPGEELTISTSSSTARSTSASLLSPGGNRTPTLTDRHSKSISDYMDSPTSKRMSMNLDSPGLVSTEMKEFKGILLPLPPLQTTAVRLREVDARRNAQGGGFGFILRKSYLPMPDEPDKTKLVHLIEPRADYFGPLMTGDRIIEVNGELVEDAPHEVVVDLIKASGDCVNLQVASMPELMELNNRGALDDNRSDNPFERNTGHRKSGKAKQGTGVCVCVGSCVLGHVVP